MTLHWCVIGWVKRRKEETAKRIDEIHKDVAKEEAAAAANSKMNRRASSSQNLRRSSSMASAPVVDEDGFVSIPSRGSMNRSGSRPNMVAPPSSMPGKPNPKAMRRSQSQPVGMHVDGTGSPVKQKSVSTASNLPAVPSSMPTTHEAEYKSPAECAGKAKSILKEYFVGGDTADAVLSFDELVCAGKEGSIERGAKVFESGALLVMEMKETDVKKFLTVLESCIESSKIEKESVIKGLNDPLEFLGDIEIDAPLAGNHLALIVASCMNKNACSLDLLNDGPEYFKTGGKAATFAAKVLRARGGEASEGELEIIESLMTEDDKAKFSSAVELMKA